MNIDPKMFEQFKNMNPDMLNMASQFMNNMTDDQFEMYSKMTGQNINPAMAKQARQQYNNMTPQQREEVLKKAKDMDPEELKQKASYLNSLPQPTIKKQINENQSSTSQFPKISGLKEIGNQFYKENDYVNASKNYQEAILEIEELKLKSFYKKFEQQKIHELNTLEISCRANFANVNAKQNDFYTVKSQSQEILKLDQNNGKALFRLGQSYHHFKKYDLAVEYLGKAKKIITTDPIIDSLYKESAQFLAQGGPGLDEDPTYQEEKQKINEKVEKDNEENKDSKDQQKAQKQNEKHRNNEETLQKAVQDEQNEQKQAPKQKQQEVKKKKKNTTDDDELNELLTEQEKQAIQNQKLSQRKKEEEEFIKYNKTKQTQNESEEIQQNKNQETKQQEQKKKVVSNDDVIIEEEKVSQTIKKQSQSSKSKVVDEEEFKKKAQQSQEQLKNLSPDQMKVMCDQIKNTDKSFLKQMYSQQMGVEMNEQDIERVQQMMTPEMFQMMQNMDMSKVNLPKNFAGQPKKKKDSDSEGEEESKEQTTVSKQQQQSAMPDMSNSMDMLMKNPEMIENMMKTIKSNPAMLKGMSKMLGENNPLSQYLDKTDPDELTKMMDKMMKYKGVLTFGLKAFSFIKRFKVALIAGVVVLFAWYFYK